MADKLVYSSGATTNDAFGNLTTTWAAWTSGTFATADETGFGTWSSTNSQWTAPSSDLPDGVLCIFHAEGEDSSNGRCVLNMRLANSSGTGTLVSAETGGYARDNSEDRAITNGWAIIDGPSASSVWELQGRSVADAEGTADELISGSVTFVPLYYSNIGLYSTTTAQQLTGTAYTRVSGWSVDLESDTSAIELAGTTTDVVDVKGDNTRYLVLGGFACAMSGTARSQRVVQLRQDSTATAQGVIYLRQANSTPIGTSIYDCVDTSTATIGVDMAGCRGIGIGARQGGADGNGGTLSGIVGKLAVIELNGDAELIRTHDSTGQQECALAGPVDLNLARDTDFNDAASFTVASNTAINAEQAMDALVLANVNCPRNTSGISSGTRWTARSHWTVNGTEQTVTKDGDYSRGNQSSADTFGWSGHPAGVLTLALNDDLGVSVQEISGTEGGGGDIETEPFASNEGLSFIAINLDTLEAAASASPIAGDETIGFSATADLNATGDLAAAATIAFSEDSDLTNGTVVTKGDWGGVSISPLVLPIAPYSFTSKASGTSAIDAATTIAFSVQATIYGSGDLSASETIAVSDAGTLQGSGDLSATESIDFSQSATVQADGQLQGSEALAFSESADLVSGGSNAIAADETLVFSESATLQADGELQATTSIDFTESATVGSDGVLQGSATLAFSESASVGSTGPLQTAETIAFSESVTLTGDGDLSAAESLAFTDSATLAASALKGDWGNTSVSPLILPIRPYVFAPPNALLGSLTVSFSESADLSATGEMQHSDSIDFTQSGSLRASGSLLGNESIDFSQVATVQAGGDLSASTSIAFSVDATATGDSGANLAASESIDVSQTATLQGIAGLQSTETVAFSTSATVQADGSLLGSESIAFTENATLAGNLAPYQVSPLVLPIGRYSFAPKQITLKTDASFSFGNDATLTGGGSLGGDNIRGSTSIGDIFTYAVWLEGRGQLLGSTSIDFGNQAVLNADLGAETTITFDQSATLTADGRLVASSSIDFSQTAGLSQDVGIQGSVSVDFSESASITMFGRIQASTSVGFSESVHLGGTGPLAATTAIAFSENASGIAAARLRGSTSIRFLNPGQLFRQIRGDTSIEIGHTANLGQVLPPASLRVMRDVADKRRLRDEMDLRTWADVADYRMLVDSEDRRRHRDSNDIRKIAS